MLAAARQQNEQPQIDWLRVQQPHEEEDADPNRRRARAGENATGQPTWRLRRAGDDVRWQRTEKKNRSAATYTGNRPGTNVGADALDQTSTRRDATPTDMVAAVTIRPDRARGTSGKKMMMAETRRRPPPWTTPTGKTSRRPLPSASANDRPVGDRCQRRRHTAPPCLDRGCRRSHALARAPPRSPAWPNWHAHGEDRPDDEVLAQRREERDRVGDRAKGSRPRREVPGHPRVARAGDHDELADDGPPLADHLRPCGRQHHGIALARTCETPSCSLTEATLEPAGCRP